MNDVNGVPIATKSRVGVDTTGIVTGFAGSGKIIVETVGGSTIQLDPREVEVLSEECDQPGRRQDT